MMTRLSRPCCGLINIPLVLEILFACFCSAGDRRNGVRLRDRTATADFAHLDGDPFAYLRAFVYATGALVHKGISEEGNQPLKIPNSYKDAVKSPQWKDCQGAIQIEMTA